MKRELLAEALGSALLLFMIVGSGVAAERLATDPAVALMSHAVAVGMALAVLIVVFGPISGAHFNPVVTLALWRSGAIASTAVAPFLAAQVVGAVLGSVVANLSFAGAAVAVSSTSRLTIGTGVSEVVVTFVLLLLILVLVQIERTALVAPAVGAWVTAAIFGTSSTGFANPSVTVARMFTDSYTGIDPGSVPGFVLAQIVGAVLAVAAVSVLAPRPKETV